MKMTKLGQRVLIGVILVCGSVMSVNPSDSIEELKERVRFHLNGLKRSLKDIQTLQEQTNLSGSIQTRSTDSYEWDLFMSPIFSFCETVAGINVTLKEDPPARSTNSPLSDVDAFVISTKPVTLRTIAREYGNTSEWFLPEVRPLRVRAERDGTKVRVVFDVLHPGSTIVARIGSFNFARADLDTPRQGNYLSQVQFLSDASVCRKDKFGFEEDYTFIAKDLERFSSGANLRIDTCGFDKFQNQSLDLEDRSWQTRESPIVQTLEYPKFRLISKTNKDIILKPGRNEIIEFEAHLSSRISLMFFAHMFDYDTRKVVRYGNGVDVYGDPRGEPRIEDTDNTKDKPFLLEVIRKSNFVNKTVDKEFDRDMNLTLRMTLLAANRRYGGDLFLQGHKRRRDYYMRNVTTSVDTGLILRFRQSGLPYPPPNLKPVIFSRERFVCKEEGDDVFPRDGRNCTLSCNGYGPKITTISITKQGSPITPFRSVSYSLGKSAFAMIDVGPASSEIEGSYQCTVESGNGRAVKILSMYTTGFPRIVQNVSTFVQFENGTSEATCTAAGSLPMNLTLEIKGRDADKPYQRIDNNPDYNSTITQLDNGMVLKLRVPTDDLKYPQELLTCRLWSDRGSDMHTFYLYNAVDNYYETAELKFDKTLSRINSYDNGSTLITCKASGAAPLDIWIAQGDFTRDHRIDRFRSFVKWENTTDEGKTVFLLVPTARLTNRAILPWLYCLGSNNYGRDLVEFWLRDYFDL